MINYIPGEYNLLILFERIEAFKTTASEVGPKTRRKNVFFFSLLYESIKEQPSKNVYKCFYKKWKSNSFHTSGTPGKHQCMQSE